VKRSPSLRLAALALAGAMSTTLAQAADVPPENVLNLSASASLEVTKDLLAITLQTVRDGNDAASVQTQLKQTLDAALAESKKAAAPGQLDVRTGNFMLHPRYGKDGKINGWQGQADLVLEGKDTQRIAQTAGRLQGMNIVNVAYSLSRELNDKHEAEVSAQAIQNFRAKAQQAASQFGFSSYALREVAMQTEELGGPRPPVMYRGKAEMAMASADAPVPTEPGKGTILATVNGSIYLRK
jgi:predicted secreted protein